MLTRIAAKATTCEITPGEERVDGVMLRIRNRIFTDLVEAHAPGLAGINQPALSIALDPQTGEGTLEGRFTLRPGTGDGSWEGVLGLEYNPWDRSARRVSLARRFSTGQAETAQFTPSISPFRNRHSSTRARPCQTNGIPLDAPK